MLTFLDCRKKSCRCFPDAPYFLKTGVVAWCLFSFCAHAVSPDQTASVLDASGHVSTSGVMRCVGAGGQSGGCVYSSGGDIQHYGGFAGACILMPDLDIDGDGVANELDADNDGDTLADQLELSGEPWLPATVASDPNVPDTDADGFADGAEAAAGTDPTDAASALVIVDMVPVSTNMVVTWLARDGKTYRLDHYSALSGSVTTSSVATVTVNDPSAVAPWYETLATETDFGILSTVTTSGFYRVVLEP